MRCLLAMLACVGCSHASSDPCDTCNANELCIQRFDGTCRVDTTCVPRAQSCHDPSPTDRVCATACQDAYCPAPYTCTARVGCNSESPKAFTCYGP